MLIHFFGWCKPPPMDKEQFAAVFDPKNRVGDPKESFSPSGKYRLILESFRTGEGTWNVTQGTLYKVGEDEPIGCIQRNYCAFPHLWVEGHPKGDFFVGGEDYQGQTVIDLGTGARRDLLPEEAAQGHGFCWAEYTYHPEHQVLLVDGCYWACPYEYRLYDFSDPMNGWPQLEMTGHGDEDEYQYIPADGVDKKPELSPEGVLTVYQTKDECDVGLDYDGSPLDDLEWEGEGEDRFAIVARKAYKIQDGKLAFQSEWVSDPEKEYRVKCEESRRRYEAWKDNFRETDPLYLAFAEGKKDPGLSPDDYEWSGFTYADWCPGHEFKETYRGANIAISKEGQPYDIKLEWATGTGPVKLTIYKDGDKVETKFWMEHSPESIRAAFEYAKSLLKG